MFKRLYVPGSLFLILLGLALLPLNLQAQFNNQGQEKGFASPGSTTAGDSSAIAIISTKLGQFEIELYTNDAPKTAANFIGLAKQGYYNGVIFHRIVKGFIIQGGDSTGTGAFGRSIYGRKFEDELNPETRSYQEGYMRGVVAMANSGPNTNSSQFFILIGDAPSLPKAYTIFGRVIKGMEVVDSIADAEIIGSYDGPPVEPVSMQSVVIVKRPRQIDSIFELK